MSYKRSGAHDVQKGVATYQESPYDPQRLMQQKVELPIVDSHLPIHWDCTEREAMSEVNGHQDELETTKKARSCTYGNDDFGVC